MTASEEYLATLARLSPSDVSTYLANYGWQQQEQIGRATLWALTDGEAEFEVLVPRDIQVRDYPLRMIELLQVLSDAEDRIKSQILRDLIRTNVDTTYVRTHPMTPPGTISVSDGFAAIEGIRELMLTGAYSIGGEPVLTLPRRKPRQVEDFPKQARLGPASEGSYILSVEIPVDVDEETLFAAGSPPFGRRVLLRLYDAIRTARDAANEALEISELGPFTERVGEGISTNLCRALARFGGADKERPFEVRFSWAAALPTGIVTPPLRFDERMVPVLAQAEEDLGGKSTTERDAVVEGTVWRTERNRPTERGWVVVRGVTTASGRRRRRLVWIQLEPDLFSDALRAADHGWTVRMTGTLVRTGQRTELRELMAFAIVGG